MKGRRFLALRFLLYSVILIITLLIITSSYVYINREKLVNSFLLELKEQVGLDMRYSNFRLNLKDFFPFAAFSFYDFELKHVNSAGIENQLSANKLNLTINTLDLIRGKYTIRNCIVETGLCSVDIGIIDSLINEFSSQDQSYEKTSTSLTINKFQLKNFSLMLNNKIKLNVINSLIWMNLNDNNFSISMKSDLENFIYNDKRLINGKFRIAGQLDGNESTLKTNSIRVEYKTLDMDLHGTYSKKTGDVSFNFISNNFNINDMWDYIPKIDDLKVTSGKTSFNGFCSFNAESNIFKVIQINHSTKAKIIYKSTPINIIELTGSSNLTNNLKNHYSEISSLKLKQEKSSANLKIKIKGINNPILLVEGQINIDNNKVNYLEKSLSLNAVGSIKTLVSVHNSNQLSKRDIIFHKINGQVKYNIGKIEGVDRLSEIEGGALLGNNLQINATAKFDDKPFDIRVTQNNFLKLINSKVSITPNILVNAEFLDVDYLLDISDEFIGNDSSKNEDQYSIELNSKELRFFDYDFNRVNASISYKNELIEIHSFEGNGFQGKISGRLKNKGNFYYIESSFNKINISELFKHYNNFSQSLVTSRNINGDLSGKAFLNFETDTNGDIKTPSIKLDSDILIQNGKLIGMNKIKKLSKWLKLNEVKSIDFETIQNKIEIKDQNLKIPKMDILSNVINLQLSGEHHFNNTYTYWMRINLSKIIAQRLLSLNFYDDQENTSDGAINLYLKLYGNSEDYEVKMDKKASFEKIKGNFEIEGIILKDLLLQEFKQIGKKDSLPKIIPGDTANKRNSTFTIEWDEYDSLNIENNLGNDI